MRVRERRKDGARETSSDVCMCFVFEWEDRGTGRRAAGWKERREEEDERSGEK